MLIGAHVRAGAGLGAIIEHGERAGADAVQIFTQSPRVWKPNRYAHDVLARVAEAQAASAAAGRVRATYCHATYLVNLAGPDPELYRRSIDCLAANLAVAAAIGSAGLVVHLGSHRGRGFETSLPQIADALVEVMGDTAEPAGSSAGSRLPPILIENTAGAGGTIGRSFDEIAAVIAAVASLSRAAASRLGVCLDTQHLWASGVDFASHAGADRAVDDLASSVGLDRLRCLHLNDSKVALGSARDRHANLGEGTIGAEGLAWLLGHPALMGMAAILEVPGAGDGPRAEDVAAARRILAEGIALRDGLG